MVETTNQIKFSILNFPTSHQKVSKVLLYLLYLMVFSIVYADMALGRTIPYMLIYMLRLLRDEPPAIPAMFGAARGLKGFNMV